MSTFSGGYGRIEEDGGGWNGLAPSAEDRRARKKPMSDSAYDTWKSAPHVLVRDLLKGDGFICISGYYWKAGDWYKGEKHVRYATRLDGHTDTFCANAEVIATA